MNLERYKTEMSRHTPDRKFVENTLDIIKNNRTESKIDKKQIIKTIGGLSLTAAVLCGAVIGGGAVRSLFQSIEPIDTEQTADTYTQEPVTEEAVETEEITATDKELLVSPLAANPKYTLKAVNADGKVSLDDETTVEEMLACGVPVVTEHGNLGMEYFCKALQKQKNRQAFSFIMGDVVSGNNYDYYEINNYGGLDKFWQYNHSNYFSITKWNGYMTSGSFAGYEEKNGEAGASICLANSDNGIVSIVDTLAVSGYDKEMRKQMFFGSVTAEADHRSIKPTLGIKYNDKFPGAFRLNYFIKNIENGAEYAGVQFTDITTTDEYDECYYSIEYVNGTYIVFTMKDGLNGTYDTQYFDGYTVTDNILTFDNGTAAYSFEMSKTPVEDYNATEELIRITDKFSAYGYYNFGNALSDAGPLDIVYDSRWFKNEIKKADLINVLVINEEYSTEDKFACAVQQCDMSDGGSSYAKLCTNPLEIGSSPNGTIYKIGKATVHGYNHADYLKVMPDGKFYAMLTAREIEELKDHSWVIDSAVGNGSGTVNTIEVYVTLDGKFN